MEQIALTINALQSRIEAAATRAGRDPKEIKLMAVTKTYGAEFVQAAATSGIAMIGENKVQEAKEKMALIPSKNFELHLIGHLQTNKVRQAVEIFDMIQSVDSERLAAEIDRRAYTKDRIMPILLQVNTSREKSKYGLDPDNVMEAVKQISEFKNIRIRGLMTIGALTAITANDSEKIRSYFKRLRELRDFIRDQKILNVDMEMLSMGMSSDFEIAIEEGSTCIRVGTAIFGKRKRMIKTKTEENA